MSTLPANPTRKYRVCPCKNKVCHCTVQASVECSKWLVYRYLNALRKFVQSKDKDNDALIAVNRYRYQIDLITIEFPTYEQVKEYMSRRLDK